MLCLVSSFRELSYCLGILCLFISICSLLIPVMTCSEKELNILKFLTYSNYIFQKVSINDFPHFLHVQMFWAYLGSLIYVENFIFELEPSQVFSREWNWWSSHVVWQKITQESSWGHLFMISNRCPFLHIVFLFVYNVVGPFSMCRYEPLAYLLGKEYFFHAYGPIYALSAEVVASLVALRSNRHVFSSMSSD